LWDAGSSYDNIPYLIAESFHWGYYSRAQRKSELMDDPTRRVTETGLNVVDDF